MLWETETEGSRGLVGCQTSSRVNETHDIHTHTNTHIPHTHRAFSKSLVQKNLLPTNRVLSLGCELDRFSLCQNPSGIASCLMVTEGSQGVPVVGALHKGHGPQESHRSLAHNPHCGFPLWVLKGPLLMAPPQPLETYFSVRLPLTMQGHLGDCLLLCLHRDECRVGGVMTDRWRWSSIWSQSAGLKARDDNQGSVLSHRHLSRARRGH